MNDQYGRRRDDRGRFARFDESEQGRYRGPSGQSEWEQQGQGSLSEGRFQGQGFGQDRGYNYGERGSEGLYGRSGGRFGQESSDGNSGRYRSEPGSWRGPEGTYGQSTQGRGGWPGRGGYEEERGRGARDWGSSESTYGWRGDDGRSDESQRGGWGGGQQDWAVRGSASRHGIHSGDGATEGVDVNQQRYGGRYGFGSGEGRSRGGPMMRPESGRYYGKGPKGYARSDERIKEQVSERLEENGEIDASELTVEVKNGEVTLEGTVPDRSMKRMAEDVVERCPGVKDVQNRLRVEKGDGFERSSRDKDKESRSGSSHSGGTPTGFEKTPGSRSTL